MIKIGEKQYLTPSEYAIKEGVTIQTIYNWIKEGKLSTRKLMDKTLIQV